MNKSTPILMQPSAAQNKAMHKVMPQQGTPGSGKSAMPVPPPSPAANKGGINRIPVPSPAANKATPKLMHPSVQGSQWGAGPAQQVGGSSGDAASGLPTGKRQHKPMQAIKPMDKASQGSGPGFNPDPPPPGSSGQGGFGRGGVNQKAEEEDELPAGLPNPNQHKASGFVRPGSRAQEDPEEEEPIQAMPSPVQNKAQGFMKPGAAQQDEEEEIMQNKARGLMKPGGAQMDEEEEPIQMKPAPAQSQFKSKGMSAPGSDVMFNPQPEPPADPVMPQQPGGFTK
jgi:hypothetical protein